MLHLVEEHINKDCPTTSHTCEDMKDYGNAIYTPFSHMLLNDFPMICFEWSMNTDFQHACNMHHDKLQFHALDVFVYTYQKL